MKKTKRRRMPFVARFFLVLIVAAALAGAAFFAGYSVLAFLGARTAPAARIQPTTIYGGLEPADYYAFLDGEMLEDTFVRGTGDTTTQRGISLGSSAEQVLVAYGGLLGDFTVNSRTQEGVPLLDTWYEAGQPGSFTLFLPMYKLRYQESGYYTYENIQSLPSNILPWQMYSGYELYQLWITVTDGKVSKIVAYTDMGG